MAAELVMQKAIRARLVGTAAVTALIVPEAILDTNARPAPSPSIILGEGQLVDDGDHVARDVSHLYSTLHVWKKEPGLAGVKAIAGAIRAAIGAGRAELEAGAELIDWRVSSTQFLRDPDGETAHAVVTIESLVREV
jgi:hypothetical protein